MYCISRLIVNLYQMFQYRNNMFKSFKNKLGKRRKLNREWVVNGNEREKSNNSLIPERHKVKWLRSKR